MPTGIQAHLLQQPASQLAELQPCQAIVFEIAGHWLAIPHTALLRVVHRTALNQNVSSGQLAHIGTQPLLILDLSSVLEVVRSDRLQSQNQHSQNQLAVMEAQSEAQFLVIAAIDTILVGIPVHQPPVLLEVPLTTAQALPPAYYKAIGGIASHIATVPQLGAVLLLNLHAVT